MTHELAGFTYEFVDKMGERTLLLLHGTGGDERDLLPLGERLDPDANLLSPLGRIQEGGMNRFFARPAEGVFDTESIATETVALARFVDRAAAAHALTLSNITAIGYSNGANIALSLLSTQPDLIKSAILFRPARAALADSFADLSGVRILIAAGEHDELAPMGDAELLRDLLREGSATVSLHISAGGHGLQLEDEEAAQRWLHEYLA